MLAAAYASTIASCLTGSIQDTTAGLVLSRDIGWAGSIGASERGVIRLTRKLCSGCSRNHETSKEIVMVPPWVQRKLLLAVFVNGPV